MNKEQLTSIFERHDLTIERLAQEAEVTPAIVANMLEGTAIGDGPATHVPLRTFHAHQYALFAG